ncbi:MAG: hypothetical protein HY885_14205 [Deltaproteobacteria bacterium]|nr:hypothetical protein [Deltaproteobacteria bacterium]
MTFLNETWFWTGAFAAIGSLGAVLIKEVLSSKTQIGIERLRLHERECLDAYKKLYRFITSLGNALSPPEDPRRDFFDAMKHSYIKEVEPNMLLFTEEIRKMLRELQSQYACLGNPDLIPPMNFDDFIRKRAARLLEELTKAVERQTDIILHKMP